MIESSIQPPEMHHAEKAKRVARSRKSSKNMKLSNAPSLFLQAMLKLAS
jgi:hypothetical protein